MFVAISPFKVHADLIIEVFNKRMAMTMDQLERYMISEVENLHIKIDSAFEMLSSQIKELADHMTLRFDRIEKQLDQHNLRILSLENSSNKRKP